MNLPMQLAWIVQELKKKMNERPRSRYLVLQKEVPPQQAEADSKT